MVAKKTRLLAIISAVPVLLMVPLIAMLFTKEVNWTVSDFVAMGMLLLGAGLGCELILRKVKKTSYRIAICVAILFAFLFVWAELAVGIFGTPFAGS